MCVASSAHVHLMRNMYIWNNAFIQIYVCTICINIYIYIYMMYTHEYEYHPICGLFDLFGFIFLFFLSAVYPEVSL